MGSSPRCSGEPRESAVRGAGPVFDRRARGEPVRRPAPHYRGPGRPGSGRARLRLGRRPAGSAAAPGCECVEGAAAGPLLRYVLSAQAEPLDQGAVARDVGLGEVLQEPTATADQQQEAAAAVVVVLVQLEVLGEVADALAQHGDLDLRRAGVPLYRPVL